MKPLSSYRAKRNFAKTSEPSGESAHPTSGREFVIQKHAARRLHYDFRLELDGVLLSWSVPKGPSLKAGEKRLAVRVEDHPLDYVDFEGIIPKGQYGGGTVIVWDRGTWEPEGDVHEGVKKGRITFTLAGAKLRGRWHLVRTKSEGKADNWLLFKSRDDAANENVDVIAELPASVISGRTIEEVAEAPDRVWQSDRVKPADIVAQLPLGYRVTNLDKVLYPDDGITKGDLLAYLAVVADTMLPHVARRPLTLVRCPDGHDQPCFFQRNVLPGSPKAIDRDPLSIHDMPGLLALAQLGTLEIHTWGAHVDAIERPDLLVFDLDPDEELPWERVALAAFEIRRRLDELGFAAYVKTTGGKGLHVVARDDRALSWDDFKAFAKSVVEDMERAAPSLYTTNMSKRSRKGKIFLDYLRNGRSATFIAPYSPRARAGAPVATPITWEELAHGVDPKSFTIVTVPKRLAQLGADPWADLLA